MGDFVNEFWSKKLEDCAKALRKNGFEVSVAADRKAARTIALQSIETRSPATIGFADSKTMLATGTIAAVREDHRWELIDGFDPGKERSENLKTRRKALLSELFMTGINAVTQDGKLLWLDMIGNRIAPIAFGPLNVILFAGRNKICENEIQARQRIKTLAAPINAIAHPRFRTPCQITAVCCNCASDDRICNSWLIMEKCFPKQRIHVILINEDLGF